LPNLSENDKAELLADDEFIRSLNAAMNMGMIILSYKPAMVKIPSPRLEQLLLPLKLSPKLLKKRQIYSPRKRLRAEKWISPCSV
jgi:hypothetical protein